MNAIKLLIMVLGLISVLAFAGLYISPLGSSLTPPAIVNTLEKNRLSARRFRFINGKLTPFELDSDEGVIVTIS